MPRAYAWKSSIIATVRFGFRKEMISLGALSEDDDDDASFFSPSPPLAPPLPPQPPPRGGARSSVCSSFSEAAAASSSFPFFFGSESSFPSPPPSVSTSSPVVLPPSRFRPPFFFGRGWKATASKVLLKTFDASYPSREASSGCPASPTTTCKKRVPLFLTDWVHVFFCCLGRVEKRGRRGRGRRG